MAVNSRDTQQRRILHHVAVSEHTREGPRILKRISFSKKKKKEKVKPLLVDDSGLCGICLRHSLVECSAYETSSWQNESEAKPKLKSGNHIFSTLKILRQLLLFFLVEECFQNRAK